MWGNVGLWLQNNILNVVSGELRATSASPILGGHRMALGYSGLHAILMSIKCLAPNFYAKFALPYLATINLNLFYELMI